MRTKIFIIIISVLLSFRVISQPGCPSINAGVNQYVDCAYPCATIAASVFATGATNSYDVTQIPYTPPAAYNIGNPILVNEDDVWSSIVPLPFSFCFYGNLYNNVVIGDNGIISFDTVNKGAFCGWDTRCGLPIPAKNYPLNTIMCPYQDLDPSIEGHIYWQLFGTFPCRILVVSYDSVPYFGDPNSGGPGRCPDPLYATFQVALYETTNVIEMYIQTKDDCIGWNNGLAIEGIQDETGTKGAAVPGRNNTVWTASNDAWRFTPVGIPNYTVTWWKGSTQVGSGDTITVCPQNTTTYRSQVVYNCCAGNHVVLTDSVTVTVTGSIHLAITPSHPRLCMGSSDTLTATSIAPNTTYQWNTGMNGPVLIVSPTTTTTYTVTATSPACTTYLPIRIIVSAYPTVNVSSQKICVGQSASITASGASSYLWDNGETDSTITVSPVTTTTYTVTGSNSGCNTTGSGVVTIDSLSVITTSTNENCYLSNGTATVTATNGTGSYTYSWNTVPQQTSATVVHLAEGNYIVTVNDGICTATSNATVNNIPGVSATISDIINERCHNSGNGSETVNANGGMQPYTYIWSSIPAQTDSILQHVHAGTYTVTVTDANGCIASAAATVYLTDFSAPVAGFIEHPRIITSLDGPVIFMDNSTGDIMNWQWNFGDSTYGSGSLTQHQYIDPGTYFITLIVTDNNGCMDTASDTIKVKDYFTFYVPNAFTPAGDGKNDLFYASGINVDPDNFNMMIFDRLGMLIFNTNKWDGNRSEGWNGTKNNMGSKNDVAMDVYVYVITVKELNGLLHEYTGRITLVR